MSLSSHNPVAFHVLWWKRSLDAGMRLISACQFGTSSTKGIRAQAACRHHSRGVSPQKDDLANRPRFVLHPTSSRGSVRMRSTYLPISPRLEALFPSRSILVLDGKANRATSDSTSSRISILSLTRKDHAGYSQGNRTVAPRTRYKFFH
jgi:hypothetical protein